jgi:hypothetical protein
MSIQYTYTSLVAALQTYAEDDDPDFVAAIPDMIGKAELRVLRDLDLELFEQWLQVTVSASNRNVTKPADVIEVNELFIRDPATLKWIDCPRRSFEYCIMYAPTESVTAVPAFYSEFDEDDIYVVPTPDQSYSGGNARIRATIRPTGLASGNQNTWLGDNMGDILFAAAMIEVYDYLKHRDAMEKAAQKYQSLIPGLMKETEDIQRPQYKQLNTRKQGAND